MKHVWKAAAAGAMACMLLAGCTAGGSRTVQTNREYEALWATDQPVTYSIFQYNAKPFDDGYAIFHKAAEMTNVSLKGYLAKSVTEVGQAFNLMMASGEIADIVCYTSKAEFSKYGASGAFLPLNDLIEQYAPNIQKTFEELPEVRKMATSLDGNIYFIPYIPDGEVSQVWYMRQDWLDKLGLQRPRTTDEFYQVLKAFREQDPNGNGQQDEIPLFAGGGKDSFNTIVPLWGANCWWTFDDNHNVVYGPAQPEYKAAYIDLAKWYAEKLIDPEIFTRGSTALSKLLGDNLGGSVHAWAGSTALYNDTLKDAIPGFDWRVIAPPGEKGSSARVKATENGWAISSAAKNPETLIKYFDFWYSEEGRRLANFGIEGEHYDMVDGQPIFKDSVLHNEKPVVTQMNEIGAQMRIGCRQDFDYEKQWLSPIALEGIDEYVKNGYCISEAEMPQFLRTEEEDKEYTALQGIITSYVEETTQKWVMGMEDPAQGFDAYLAKLKSLNLDRLVELQQTAYDRFMAQ